MGGGGRRRVIEPKSIDGIPEVSVQDVHLNSNQVMILDVRTPEEFVGELGHIQGARLVTLGDELRAFLEGGDRNQEIIFVCRSGARSGRATMDSISLGYKYVANMTGGMIAWNGMRYPVERD